jgi:hypothetical protein
MGGHRFIQIQRGLGGISAALLSRRLRWLCECGLLTRRAHIDGAGQRYYPTQSAIDLQPVLMLYLERSGAFEKLSIPRVVVRFEFEDLTEQRMWWLVISGNKVEVCTTAPEFDVDVYLKSSLSAMTSIWLGHDHYSNPIASGFLSVNGEQALTRDIGSWLKCSEFDADRNNLRLDNP